LISIPQAHKEWVLEEEFEDTKEVIRIRKSKDRQHNGQKNKQRSTKHTHKDRVTRTPLKTGGELIWCKRSSFKMGNYYNFLLVESYTSLCNN
jgi:hypothetical protein